MRDNWDVYEARRLREEVPIKVCLPRLPLGLGLEQAPGTASSLA
jgi:hypothetical protein